jgi:hypothetical protein
VAPHAQGAACPRPCPLGRAHPRSARDEAELTRGVCRSAELARPRGRVRPHCSEHGLICH